MQLGMSAKCQKRTLPHSPRPNGFGTLDRCRFTDLACFHGAASALGRTPTFVAQPLNASAESRGPTRCSLLVACALLVFEVRRRFP